MKKYNLVIVKLFLLLLLLTPSLAGADANTVLLLHGDGTGNAFTDSSASAHPITDVGNATQSATESKFGGKSTQFDGNGARLTVASNSEPLMVPAMLE